MPPLSDLVNVAQKLDDMDAQTLSTGIQTPGGNKGASIRSTQKISEGQKPASPQPVVGQNSPSQIRTQALLIRLLATIDAQIGATLTKPLSSPELLEAKLVLVFLGAQRNMIVQGINAPPGDVSLRESLVDNIAFVETRLKLLQETSTKRLLPLVQFLREQYSGLILYGISKPQLKTQLKEMRSEIEDGIPAAAETKLVERLASTHSQIEKLLSQNSQVNSTSLLSSLLAH